jgi:hypothetical protein
MKPLEQQTPAQRTKFLSREIIIGLAVQGVVLLLAMAKTAGALDTRLTVLESNKIDRERIAKLETQMDNVIISNAELRAQQALLLHELKYGKPAK